MYVVVDGVLLDVGDASGVAEVAVLLVLVVVVVAATIAGELAGGVGETAACGVWVVVAADGPVSVNVVAGAPTAIAAVSVVFVAATSLIVARAGRWLGELEPASATPAAPPTAATRIVVVSFRARVMS